MESTTCDDLTAARPHREPKFDDGKPRIPIGFTYYRWVSLVSFSARPYPGTKKWYGTGGKRFVAVVDFGSRIHAPAVTSGGESGNPSSPHFNDEGERYATGELRTSLLLSRPTEGAHGAKVRTEAALCGIAGKEKSCCVTPMEMTTAAVSAPPQTNRVRRTVDAVMTRPVDWLVAMIVSWVIPLEMVGNHVTYFTSLVFWAVPIVLLLFRLYHHTDPGSRRRRAFWLSTAFIFVAGAILDFLLGSSVLHFDKDPTHKIYIYRFPFGQHIPLEEMLFYLMGGMAIVLVYFWADEYWMSAYNRRQRRTNAELPLKSGLRLIRFSPHALVWAVLLLSAGFAVKWWRTGSAWPPPIYFTFLVFISIGPAIAVARDVSKVVNWRAFSFTCLYVLVTSCIWEVTLGLPGSWWWYREPPAMMNWYLRPFSLVATRPYPIEALLVWLVVSFDSIFAYEFLKGITYEPRGVKVALFGE